MGYLIGIVIVGLLFFVLHYLTEMRMKNKAIVVVTLLLMVMAAGYYNDLADKERSHILEIQVQYEQGKTLKCAGYDVNQSTFSYSVGTQTFIGKKDTPNYAVMIPVLQCQ